jgi:hypothetical protein
MKEAGKRKDAPASSDNYLDETGRNVTGKEPDQLTDEF